MEKIMIISTVLLFTLSAQGMQQQLILDEQAVKLAAQYAVRCIQDPEFARREMAISFYVTQKKDLNGYDLRGGKEWTLDERKERVRKKLDQGRLAINSNGYLYKVNIDEI